MSDSPTQEQRNEMLMKIAEMWRGNSSGYPFDGRCGRRWIEVAITGTIGELQLLDDELESIGDSY